MAAENVVFDNLSESASSSHWSSALAEEMAANSHRESYLRTRNGSFDRRSGTNVSVSIGGSVSTRSRSFMVVLPVSCCREPSNGNELMNFAFSNILKAGDILTIVAVDIKSVPSATLAHNNTLAIQLASVVDTWKPKFSYKRVSASCTVPMSPKWTLGVLSEAGRVCPDVLLVGSKELTSKVHIKVQKTPYKLLKLLPACCEVIVVHNSTCVYQGRGDNGASYSTLNQPMTLKAPTLRSSLSLQFPQKIESPTSQGRNPYSQPSTPGSGPQYPDEQDYTLDEVVEATGNFSDVSRIGQGGCGVVYRAFLRGEWVAVKRLKLVPDWFDGSHEVEFRQFVREVNTARSLSHRNLMSIKGYCVAGSERMILFDYMANGSLDARLRDTSRPPLTWDQRLHIAMGAALALNYLHSEAREPYIHRDVKSANILLDAQLNAKVADFDLVKKVEQRDVGHSVMATQIFGTMGYLDPEYWSTGKVSQKSDVFSFGVVLWELISALQASDDSREIPLLHLHLQHSVDQGALHDIVDPRLESFDERQMERLVKIASLCTAESSDLRPDMEKVVRYLRGTLQQ